MTTGDRPRPTVTMGTEEPQVAWRLAQAACTTPMVESDCGLEGPGIDLIRRLPRRLRRLAHENGGRPWRALPRSHRSTKRTRLRGHAGPHWGREASGSAGQPRVGADTQTRRPAQALAGRSIARSSLTTTRPRRHRPCPRCAPSSGSQRSRTVTSGRAVWGAGCATVR
jgi:hypothetical protein